MADIEGFNKLEVYNALDTLLEAIGRLPMNQITTRPPLHKAYIQGLEVIDRAVKEGRYVPSQGPDN